MLLVLAPCLLTFFVHRSLQGWALYSEEEVLKASVHHPLFTTDEHFYAPSWSGQMSQRDRLDALDVTIHGAAKALRKVGLRPFLESASLIGWMRHGGQIPWDTDGDLGILRDECLAANVTKRDVESAAEDDIIVLKFACECEEDCEGDNKRMAGRFAHRATGVCIDIFAYAPVKQARSWQLSAQSAGKEWWERVDCHADYTFPREALLPLKTGTFVGAQMLLPNVPREFLGWEYGRCLEAHVWPWGLLLYTQLSPAVATAVVAKGAMLILSSDSKPATLVAALIGASDAMMLSVFERGIAVVMLVGACICQFCAVRLQQGPGSRRKSLAVVVATLALAFELRGSLRQLACQVNDFYIHPQRPKPWTLCLFGHCWDFER